MTVTRLTQEQIDQFHRDGFLVIPNFISRDTIQELKTRMDHIVQKGFHPEEMDQLSIFSTTENKKARKQNDDDYFMESGDQIRFFVEKEAVQNGNLICPKNQSLNKVAHALHDKDPVYQKFSHQKRILNIFQQLNHQHLERPEHARIVQSMYIFKSPKIGGEVTPHVDATFLTVNNPSLTGYWFALDDATVENGCLWGWPGSHKRDLPVKMYRKDGGRSQQTELLFDEHIKDFDFWHPEKHMDKYVPLNVPAGGLVIIHGGVVHKSSNNVSDKSRHAYTFHVASLPTKESWSKLNWLQREDGFPQYWPLE